MNRYSLQQDGLRFSDRVHGAGMTDKHKKYYTTKEAADLLNVAVSTIQLWANNGLLDVWTTAGGHRRIARSSVEEMVKRGQSAINNEQSKSELSVIVVEDDAQQLRLYEKHISAWGLGTKLITAKDGYEGMVKIGKTLPDVIITDLLMPNVDGFQMVKALKDVPELADTTIIAVSALEAADVRARGGLPQGVHLLTKPIVFSDLEGLLKNKIQSKIT